MICITNTKVAGFVPLWAMFRGFSILFDNPGQELTRCGDRWDLTCDVDNDTELGFYRALRDSLASLNMNLLTNTYLFCPLPPPSYHVTVWDGGNDGNVTQVLYAQRPVLDALLAGLPDTLLAPNALTDLPMRSTLVGRRDWILRFRFDSLLKWGNSVLVASLSPADADAAEALQALVAERRLLNAQYREAFGIGPADSYSPHVSLGYFANRESAQLTTACLPEWNSLFRERMEGLTLDFQQASLYGFTDMATFFKAAQSL